MYDFLIKRIFISRPVTHQAIVDFDGFEMGTDWLQLYDKNLSDKILAMNRQGLTRFLEDHIDVLKEKEKRGHSTLAFVMSEYKISVAKAVEKLLAEQKLFELKRDVAFDFCFGEEWVYLDYWGCYAHVFGKEPKGSLPSSKYLTDKEDHGFLLLKPDHVDQIIKSLKEHSDDLPVMKRMGAGIERVEYFRDFCRGHPGYWVAYQFDY